MRFKSIKYDEWCWVRRGNPQAPQPGGGNPPAQPYVAGPINATTVPGGLAVLGAGYNPYGSNSIAGRIAADHLEYLSANKLKPSRNNISPQMVTFLRG